MIIITDTREQTPLWTDHVAALKTGDYSILGFENKIAIERKSLIDLFGTLTHGHERFRKELARAEDMDYFAIVIDGSLTKCLSKSFKGGKFTKMSGHVILKILCTLSVKYGVRFYFCNNAVECCALIQTLFNSYYLLQDRKT